MRQVIVLVGALLLAGCGGTPAAPPPPVSASTSPSASPATTPPSSSPSRATTPSASVVEITLKGGKADPLGERVAVPKGTVLQLRITSDHADEVHVHGYDVAIPVAAGATVTKEIVLDRVGRFEVESHEPAFTILQLVVS